VKQKYFDQLTKNGTELDKIYELLFRCEDVINDETQFVTKQFNMHASNFRQYPFM
jgi:hypothetical protein